MNILRIRKRKKKEKSTRPTHWTLNWAGEVDLGYDDGTYLPRKAALLFYPEYFDENGEPILDKLPVGKSR